MMSHDSHDGPDGPARTLWAYGYQLLPPVARDRLGGMQAILDAGHDEAWARARVWEGRFVNGDHITHILVVSGTPSQDHDINRRLEAELSRLAAGYSVSASLEVSHDAPRRSGDDRFPGPGFLTRPHAAPSPERVPSPFGRRSGGISSRGT